MKLEGEVTFDAPRERVWAILTDAAVLRKHMPGCESLQEVAPDRYEALLKIGVAAIKGTYKATLRISERAEPESYRLHVEGQGKPGFVKGEGTVHLHENGGGTRVAYDGDLQVGGLIARVGQRILGSITQKMTHQFFEGLSGEAKAG